MGDVLTPSFQTFRDIPPDRVLDSAKGVLSQAIVIGQKEDGELYFAFSTSDMKLQIFLLEMAKRTIMDIAMENG